MQDSVTARPQVNGTPGAAEPFPDPDKCLLQWPTLFKIRPEPGRRAPEPVKAPVVPVPRVWEDVDERENERRRQSVAGLTALPPYDVCFQGF